jgi:hypothetical protein
MKKYEYEGVDIDLYFHILGSSWRVMVGFTLLPLYPRGKNPQYPLDRRFAVPQSRSTR